MPDLVFPAVSLLTLLVTTALFLLKEPRSLSPLPPGPRGLPLIGNLLDWPFESGWLTFAEWGKKFGDIIHIEIFGVHIVILNAYETAQHLMNQASYSDRPPLAMVGDLMGFMPSIVLSPYGDHWKAMRRITQQSLNRAASATFLPSQLTDARMLLQQLLENPRKHISCIRFALGKNIIENTYGIPIDSPTSEFVQISRETHEVIQNAVIPGSFLVDIFPSLRWIPSFFPGAGFKRLARLARKHGQHMVDGAFAESKKAAMRDGAIPSLVGTLLQSDPQDMTQDQYEYVVKWAAGSLYGAGTESTVSSISTFVLMMAKHPEIQKRAQAELDSVLSSNRLPTFEDRDSLPYLDSVIKEVLRTHPPTPLGIAHRLSEDDVYAGYHLPRGSIILSNIWAMSKDPRQYTDPLTFNPDRYSKENLAPELDSANLVFGFGRRACLGTHYATAAIYITVASILAVFDIRAQDEDGVNVVVKAEYTGGFVSHPKAFPCRLVPRSQAAIELIKAGTLI
ncbi:cytochrome P450 [Amylostereum chailletii]|nr:cytochrome P450 [Amylostereum chailletii]